jgi:hypothetical protein
VTAAPQCPRAPRFGMTGIPAMPGQRNLEPAWRAPDGFAAIPTAALDPPRSTAFPAVPALNGSGSPSLIITTMYRKVVS